MAGYIGTKAVLLSTTAASVTGNADIGGDLTVDTSTLYVDSTNNRVGIGTSSPNEKLAVNGGLVVSGDASASSGSGVTLSFDTTNLIGNIYSLSPGVAWHDLAIRANQTVFFGGGTERMRINSSGGVTIQGGAIGNGKLGIYSDATTAGIFIKNNGGDGYWALNFANNAGSQVGYISLNSSSTSYNTASDYRLKEDWQPMTGASDRVLALNPVNFAWKADGSRVDGFLAHEAKEVVPESVHGEKDAVDADGNPVYQGIDQSKLVPLLTAALQEALTEIAALKDRVAALEAV